MLAEKSGIDLERRRLLGGNPQTNVRLTADWQSRLDALLREDEGAATLIKEWLRPLLAQVVSIDRDEAGKVVSITGRDKRGKLTTIRCDGKPLTEDAKPLADAPTRGRPKKDG